MLCAGLLRLAAPLESALVRIPDPVSSVAAGARTLPRSYSSVPVSSAVATLK